MNLNTDNNKSSLKGVYMFYSVIITLCILALFVFDLNIYAKAVLCTLVFLCVLIMRSLKKAIIQPSAIEQEPASLSATDTDIKEDKKDEVETAPSPTMGTDSSVDNGGAIDLYLTLLIETNEELAKDPTIDKSAPNYNNQLNHRIGMKLDAMLKGNNHSDKV